MTWKSVKMRFVFFKYFRAIVKVLAFLICVAVWDSRTVYANDAVQKKIVESAEKIFNQYEISYVYGGHQLGGKGECERCNACLEKNKPSRDDKLKVCEVCSRCSLDCSHFTQMVFSGAGLKSPYLTTQTMLALSPDELFRNYHLVDIGLDISQAQDGDLLVYRGHVVLLTKLRGPNQGDIIHATSGRDVRGPGQGLQRERLVLLNHFRGPLLRILRHKEVLGGASQPFSAKLRPVEKRNPR